jgi:RNA polymerase sigma factor (sigma-70 family)
MTGVCEQLDALFRSQRAALTAALTRAFGPANLDLVEAVLQDAFVRASETWPVDGVPQRPDAWLLAVARNQLLDHLRKEKRVRDKEPAVEQWMRGAGQDANSTSEPRFAGEFADDELRMMFVSCHPCNSIQSQIALTLRTLCGMEIDEIARAILSDPQAVAKRLVRARERLRDAAVEFDLPDANALEDRLAAVMKVIYLLFNEGYSSLRGERQIRAELCHEAIRLAGILVHHPRTDTPRTHALLSLLLLQSSRLAARTDERGALLTLAEQDRARWDRARITRGLKHLEQAARGEELSEYHIEAAIAACHATADCFESTDWTRIVGYYDALADAYPSAIAAFNRAVAIGFARGPADGLPALAALQDEPALWSYFPYHAAIADFEQRAGRISAARESYARACALAGTEPERAFIQRRLEALPPEP